MIEIANPSRVWSLQEHGTSFSCWHFQDTVKIEYLEAKCYLCWQKPSNHAHEINSKDSIMKEGFIWVEISH